VSEWIKSLETQVIDNVVNNLIHNELIMKEFTFKDLTELLNQYNLKVPKQLDDALQNKNNLYLRVYAIFKDFLKSDEKSQ